MADVTDDAIKAAYEDVRSDKTQTNWLLLDYTTDKSDKLQVTGTGQGGLAEFREQLKDDKASFGFVRVEYSNDAESKREKFIFVTWIGANVKVMRRAKLSVHSSDVKQVLRSYSIEVAASSKDEDLDEQAIVTRLRKAGGASYDKA